MTITVSDLAGRLQADAQWLGSKGAGSFAEVSDSLPSIKNISRPCDANHSSLTFLFGLASKPIDAKQVEEAGAVIVERTNAHRVARPLIVDDPLVALAKANHWLPVIRSSPLNLVNGSPMPSEPGLSNRPGLFTELEEATERSHVHESAAVSEDAMVGDNTYIGANTTIGDEVSIGSFCTIGANVTINGPARLGNRVNVDANSTIGGEPFMYVADGGCWLKVPGFCGVVINDDVDIGSGSTIDKGLIDHTVVGRGVKLDSQIHLGHGVRVGQDTVIAGRTTIAGEAVIGKGCKIGGACAVSEGVTIAENVTLLGMSAVTRSLTAEGEYTSAWPVQLRREWWKQLATLKTIAKR